MDYRRRILWHGIALFLIGLLTGLAEPMFMNIRMGLAAHLEGVMNGTFVLAVGAIWREIRLPQRSKSLTYWALLGGSYGNWAVTTAAAVLGTVALTPVTGASHSASEWPELFVKMGFTLIGILIIFAAASLMWGLRRNAKP